MANLPVPAPANGVAGVDVTAAFWNTQVRDAVSFLLNPPLLVCTQTVVQSIPNNAFTAVLLDSNTNDSYTGHSTTTNTSRYVAQVAGWYVPTGQVPFAPITAGVAVGAAFAKNGTVVPGSQIISSAVNGFPSCAVPVSVPVFLGTGDYLELSAYQNSGGAVNTNVDSSSAKVPIMTVRYAHA